MHNGTETRSNSFPHKKYGCQSNNRNNSNIVGDFRMQIVPRWGTDFEIPDYRPLKVIKGSMIEFKFVKYIYNFHLNQLTF